MYQERFYRDSVLAPFRLEVSYAQSDLLICSDKKIKRSQAEHSLKKHYEAIAGYIKQNPLFLTSLSPIPADNSAPAIVQDMLTAGQVTGIGPFSAVAGAVASYVGQDLLSYCDEIVVENGGDIFLKLKQDKRLGVYLGEDKTLFLQIKARAQAFGIASSSASMGPSLNFGRAELVTVISPSAVLADAWATALSNQIQKEEDVSPLLAKAKGDPSIEGLVIALAGKVFLQGQIELAP